MALSFGHLLTVESSRSENIDSLHEAEVGIGLGDVLHVGADEDQTRVRRLRLRTEIRARMRACAALSLAFFCASFSLICRSSFSYRRLIMSSCSSAANEREGALTSFSLCESAEHGIFHLTVKTGSRLGGQSARAGNRARRKEAPGCRPPRIGEHAGGGRPALLLGSGGRA